MFTVVHVPEFDKEGKWKWVTDAEKTNVPQSTIDLVIDYLKIEHGAVVYTENLDDFVRNMRDDIYVVLKTKYTWSSAGIHRPVYSFYAVKPNYHKSHISGFRFLLQIHLVKTVMWFIKFLEDNNAEVGMARRLKSFLY